MGVCVGVGGEIVFPVCTVLMFRRGNVLMYRGGVMFRPSGVVRLRRRGWSGVKLGAVGIKCM